VSAEEHQQDLEFEEELKRSYWAMGTSERPDEIAQGVDDITAALERTLIPIIRTGAT
jgi:hypothetical protein